MLKEETISLKREEELKLRTRNMSIKEGSASSVMSGMTDSYITPFAYAINASNVQIGFLSGIPSLLSPLSQITGSRFMERYPRKRIIMISVALQALTWLPMIILGLLFMKGVFTNYLPITLVVFYSLYAALGAIAGPAWFSLLGDIVPEKIRGKYFGRRNKICGAIAMLSMVLAAFILDFFKTRGIIIIGFSVLFIIAMVARLFSAYFFTKHHEPRFKLEKEYYFSFFQFIKKAPYNNFGKFTIYVALINLATNIAGPFFTIYMLRDLGFSFTTFMLVNLSASVFSLLFMPILGKFSDKYGNRELLRIGSFIVPLLPLLWMINGSAVYIALIPQLASGIGWAAFNLAASNFIYDSVTPQRRGICVAYYNLLNGVGVFIGAILGGFLVQYVSLSFISALFFVFLISGVTRIIIAIFMFPRIKEVRKVEEPKSNPLYYLKEFNPITSIAYGLFNDFSYFGKRVTWIFRKK